MYTFLLLFIAVLPVYLIGLYTYKKDNDKEPKKLLIKLFIFGIISCFPAVILELLVGSFFTDPKNMDLFTLFIYVFVSIALIEEACKWFMSYTISYNHYEFNHVYDAIVYCVFVSLGFAVFENILYVFDGGVGTGILRAFMSIPGHVCDAIIMGNYLGLAKVASINKNSILERRNLILSILLPTIAHAVFDYCIFTESLIFYAGFALLIVWIYVYSIKRIKKVSSIENNFIDDEEEKYFVYCPRCGTKRVGKYCQNCGKYLLEDKISSSNS